MPITVVDLGDDHLRQIRVQPSQVEEAELESLDRPPGLGWAILVDGHPVMAAGLIEMWRGRAYAWALFGHDAGPYMLHISRAIRSTLDASPFTRIEMAVDAQFLPGQRFAKLIGFDLETPEPMAKFFENGKSAYLYAKVKR